MSSKISVGRSLGVAALLLWSALVLAIFYIVQRPLVIPIIKPIAASLWSLGLLILMLAASAALGAWVLVRVIAGTDSAERLILGTGIGLAILGFAGYGLAAAGWATPLRLLLALLLITAWLFLMGPRRQLAEDLHLQWSELRTGISNSPAWMALAVAAMAGMSFLFALLPPAEGFDGLLYHLALPERMLADGGLHAYNVLQFWFPSLIEGDFVWALGLGSERSAQLVHWSFLILTLALVREWSRKVLGERAAWWALLLLVSMPSLPWVAGWAYTDLALSFAGLAALYCLWRWGGSSSRGWLVASGIFAGMAMGIKYTSFLLPLVCIFWLLVWGHEQRTGSAATFSLAAALVACPWYLRNWFIMGNPFYPFVFGGLYWDQFQAAWYAGPGTGTGFNLPELLRLPFDIMTGVNDQNYFDGRMGPLFLLLLPVAVWAFRRSLAAARPERRMMLLLSSFSAASFAVWTLGIIQTSHLWQTRLLWPGLIPFAIPIGAGLAHLNELDLPKLHLSFITKVLAALVIFITLLDTGLSVAARNPLGYPLGLELRASYFRRMQPGYAAAMRLVQSAPASSSVYFLFEPRSYGMGRQVQPDVINNNLLHDFSLYGTAGEVVDAWHRIGYTHVLLYVQGKTGEFDEKFDQLAPYLRLAAGEGDYQLYSILP